MKKYAINILLTIVGGVGLLIASSIMVTLFESPPTRAEFNQFKAKMSANQVHIKEDLTLLKRGQQNIYGLIIKKLGSKHGH